MNLIPIVCLVLAAAPVLAGEPLIVAHRGASRDAPENTVPAFERAWKQGADAIEGDFHLTRDGRIVCIHDDDTARVSGRKLVVRNSTLAELRELDVGVSFKPEWKGVRVPTFVEVAATVPEDKKFFIEVKCGAEIVPVLLHDIAESRLKRGQVVIISFSAAVIREVKKQAPDLKACWLISFKKTSPLTPAPAAVLATLRDIKADGFSSRADPRVDQGYINAIRGAGYEYHCWTVDDPATALRFAALGARSITTNRPGLLRGVLKRERD